jgi:hypothetical protein
VHRLGSRTGSTSIVSRLMHPAPLDSDGHSHMSPDDAPYLPDIGAELRAQRLGFALRSLSGELVDERRKVAQLRREIAELRAQLESRVSAQRRQV